MGDTRRDKAIWWVRRDLRLADNPALDAALDRGRVVPVFVWDESAADDWSPGEASRAWLARSLRHLDARLRAAGSRLTVRVGDTVEELAGVSAETGAGVVTFSRRWEPEGRLLEERVARGLGEAGVETVGVRASLLVEPGELLTSEGTPYRVFTPYYRKWRGVAERSAATASAPAGRSRPGRSPGPARIPGPDARPDSASLDAILDARPEDAGLLSGWEPGEAGAHELLDGFVAGPLADYDEARDRPDADGTSRLSPHLHFGEIAPWTVWDAVHEAIDARDASLEAGAEAFLRQLAWREFSADVLHAHPHTPTEPLREKWRRFPWREDDEALERWKHGLTGYPLVDAGMRQLLETGWMHNRVRMVVASFLTKDLLVPWQQGARWFWERLVDADLANNTMGWQWAAGSGADAQPFFRVFNPTGQAKKHDPEGDYIRRWVPELAGAARPAEPSASERGDYPEPMIDHAEARQRALAAWESVR